jgi:predicted aspartyl protease
VVETLCGFNNSPQAHGADLLVMMGPTLMVDIGFDASWRSGSPELPSLSGNLLPALVDTGATQSCIDQLLAASLGLPIVDRRTVGGVGGSHEVNMYLAQIHVPSLSFIQHGEFAGVSLQAGGQAHKALIGRTFLKGFELHYEGHTGTVRMTKIESPQADSEPSSA